MKADGEDQDEGGGQAESNIVVGASRRGRCTDLGKRIFSRMFYRANTRHFMQRPWSFWGTSEDIS